ncbi:hypothetical protein [Pseudomonas fluorescens]|uniref:hypothetical protein n=1 Tax=Pseudomonas fluorescens TaxID=294 RepID=UPI0014867DC8|nr:hypothetical protein [Pseudomonas fluorescens]
MQEITIKETQTVFGGQSFGQGFGAGLLLSLGPLGYAIGWGASGNTDPNKWQLC